MMYNYNRGSLPYTDLATERRRANPRDTGVEYTTEDCSIGTWERIKITSSEGEKAIGRSMGIYNTLNTERADMLDGESVTIACDEISNELRSLARSLVTSPKKILAVGLGNRNLTSDSLGPLTCDKIRPTSHIKKYDTALFSKLECAEISVVTPGVTAKTGIDSIDIVASICEGLHPELVIAIDAIATSSFERLGSTFQITDTGICPGSGLFNHDGALNKDTLGAPVISIGVPTVIDARMLYLSGLGDKSIPNISDIPSPSMFVSPKEIDEIVNFSSQIIANAINKAFGLYQ